MPELSTEQWEAFLSGFPSAHLLQTASWGELKAAFGWRVRRLATHITLDSSSIPAACGAQVLFRRLPLGFSIAYIPRGPVGTTWETLLPDLDRLCRAQRAIFLKVEPDLWEDGAGVPGGSGAPPGFQPSGQAIQPPRTLLVDLRGDEAEILNRMKQKTRYNIRLALKKGVVVRPIADIPLFCRLVRITGERDRFGVHSQAYYQKVYDLFKGREECELLLAEYQGEPLAALMVFAHGDRAWYFYGASADLHRDRMPTYILQWEAMRWARQRGCTQYDLWGVPDQDEDSLEANFNLRSDGLWGVYRFKRGYGGRLRRAAGPWDRVYWPWLYRIYTWIAANRNEPA